MGRIILIVDDNPEERAIFARYLEFVGGEIRLAENGEEALQAVATAHPDLILLDLTMPTMDGWETIHALKQNPATERIPVIALTCHHLMWSRLEEAGFCGYLEKPLAPFRVLQEVERCVGKLRRRDMHPARSRQPTRDPELSDASHSALRPGWVGSAPTIPSGGSRGEVGGDLAEPRASARAW